MAVRSILRPHNVQFHRWNFIKDYNPPLHWRNTIRFCENSMVRNNLLRPKNKCRILKTIFRWAASCAQCMCAVWWDFVWLQEASCAHNVQSHLWSSQCAYIDVHRACSAPSWRRADLDWRVLAVAWRLFRGTIGKNLLHLQKSANQFAPTRKTNFAKPF